MIKRQLVCAAIVSLLPMSVVIAQDGGVIFSSPAGGPVDPHPLFGQIPTLCRINFQYTDDDHHVLQMQALPTRDGDFYSFQLHDNDTERSDFYGAFEWWDFNERQYNQPEGPFTTTEQVCSGECTIPIPPLAEWQEFALAGFEFEYLDGDHHVLEVAVAPRPYRGEIVVRFRDDGDAPYLARVSYVTFIKGNWRRERSSGSRREMRPVIRRAHRGMKVIQGFRAKFLNGDHHLKELEIDVCHDRWLSGVFRDVGDTDDPYVLEVWYAYL